jgi:hypothetical protein
MEGDYNTMNSLEGIFMRFGGTTKLAILVVIGAGVIAGMPGGCKERRSEMKQAQEKPAGMSKYEYTCSDGGPFIVIPKSLGSKWKGHKISLLNPLNPKTDYGRACAIEGKSAMIKVSNGNALVLQEPPMVSWRRVDDGKSIDIYCLQMWHEESLDSLLDRVAAKISSAAFADAGSSMEVDASGLLVMYAGDKAGDPIYGQIEITTEQGTYDLSTAQYKTADDEVDVYRLKRR